MPSLPTPAPRARPSAQPASTAPARRAARSLFAAFTPRRSAPSRSKDEAEFLSTLPVLLSGPAAAYVLAAEKASLRKTEVREMRVKWTAEPEGAGVHVKALALAPVPVRTMSVWSADSVEVDVKESFRQVLSRRRYTRTKSCTSATPREVCSCGLDRR